MYLDDSVDISNGDKDLYTARRHGFSNGKLIQIARIIVVDGTPEKAPEISRR
jgi:hypothetical protein